MNDLRTLIGWKSLPLLLACLAFGPGLGAAATAADRPNLIWIMADDLGYGDLGCCGQQVVATPHLDRMAREGLRFTQFYAGATVCAPSRSVLMTGQQHAHNHFPDFLWRNEEKVALPNKITPVGDSGAGFATEARQFADDLFAEAALKCVAENKSRPFFLYWSMVIPHANNERTRALKNGAQVPDFGPYADKDWPEPDKGQAAMIGRLDGYVGRLLAALRELRLAENTLVIFTSDNGPHNESNHSLARFNPSGPLSGIKRSLTDGGIRVPAIAWWPGRIAAAVETSHVAYFGDWMATAAELAGAKSPDGCDSISFVPTLLGKASGQSRHEFLYWEFHEGGFKQAALYQGRWKGIRSGGPDSPVRLYDLQTDIGEKTDVAARHRDLTTKIESYLATARSHSPDWEPKWPTPPKGKPSP